MPHTRRCCTFLKRQKRTDRLRGKPSGGCVTFIPSGALSTSRTHAAALLYTLAALCVQPAAAQQHHHPLHKDFYQNWKIPGTDRSCCNARVEYKTDNTIHEVGDCEPTHAIIRNGNWLVWIRQIKEYLVVPEDRILRERNPNVENAHVCWTPASGIICFVPEDTGG